MDDFAIALVESLVIRNNHDPVQRIGKKSFLLPFLKKWVPTTILDRYLVKKSELDSFPS
jgi:hypothetical protein